MRNKTSKWLKNFTPEQQMKLYNFRYWWVTSLWGAVMTACLTVLVFAGMVVAIACFIGS